MVGRQEVGVERFWHVVRVLEQFKAFKGEGSKSVEQRFRLGSDIVCVMLCFKGKGVSKNQNSPHTSESQWQK